MTNASKEKDQVQSNSGFAGTLRNIQLTDIIQMCCLAAASLCVRVRQDKDQGTIYIQEGEVVHAECGVSVGTEAFFTILGWQSGQFETMEAAVVTEPTIKEACQFLLMEAARQADELALSQAQVEEEEPSVVEASRLRVLIVDDSPIMCKILNSMLVADPSIEVVGTAGNGEEALEKMKSLSPDLITMDVNMPVMDGSTALKHIMIGSPCPVLIMSNLLPSSYSTLLSFLNLGAVDFMSKPVKSSNIVLQQQKIVERVHIAAKAKADRFHRLRCPKLKPSDFIRVDEASSSEVLLIAVSGAGGYLEMVNMITALPTASKTSVLSLQAIPPKFAPTLSSYLNIRSRFEVKPLAPDALLSPGSCHIGTSGLGLQFGIRDGRLALQKTENDIETDGIDSFDRLLNSAAELFQDRVVVILLSGAELGPMEGLHAIKAAGGRIFAPHLDSCILPATLAPAVDEELVTDMFDPAEIRDLLKRYCV